MKIKYITKDLRDIKITPDIENSVEKKLTQRLKKYSHKNQEQEIIIRAANRKQKVRVDVETMYLNYHLHAEAEVTTSEGILGGVEKCLDILDRQIEKYRTRIHRSVHKNKALNKADFSDIAIPADDSGEDDGRKIIKVEGHELKPMNVDEAALQLEVLDFQFLFFHNTDSSSPCVVYRRDDGNVGLIEG